MFTCKSADPETIKTLQGDSEKNTQTQKPQYLRNARKSLHKILLIYVGQNCAYVCHFVPYLLHSCQNDANTNLKNKFCNWTSRFYCNPSSVFFLPQFPYWHSDNTHKMKLNQDNVRYHWKLSIYLIQCVLVPSMIRHKCKQFTYREIVTQQLHDERAVLVWVFIQCIELSDGVVKCLQQQLQLHFEKCRNDRLAVFINKCLCRKLAKGLCWIS